MFFQEEIDPPAVFALKQGTGGIDEHASGLDRRLGGFQQGGLRPVQFAETFRDQGPACIRISPPASRRTAGGIHQHTVAAACQFFRKDGSVPDLRMDIGKRGKTGSFAQFLQSSRTDVRRGDKALPLHQKRQLKGFSPASRAGVPPAFPRRRRTCQPDALGRKILHFDPALTVGFQNQEIHMGVADHQGIRYPGVRQALHSFISQLFPDLSRIAPLHPEPKRRTLLHECAESLVHGKGNLSPHPVRKNAIPAGSGLAAAGKGQKSVQPFERGIERQQRGEGIGIHAGRFQPDGTHGIREAFRRRSAEGIPLQCVRTPFERIPERSEPAQDRKHDFSVQSTVPRPDPAVIPEMVPEPGIRGNPVRENSMKRALQDCKAHDPLGLHP